MNMNETTTVKDLIEYLESNFNPEDLVCFFDEGGAWCELVHVPKNLIGDWMFKYVKDKREEELSKDTEEQKKYTIESYRMVEDDCVVIY